MTRTARLLGIRSIAWALSLAVGCVLMLAAQQSAQADTILFTDLTDTVTAGGSPRLTVDHCVPEFCRTILTAPDGFTFDSTSIRQHGRFFIGETLPFPTMPAPVSDMFFAFFMSGSSTELVIGFISDSPGVSLGSCFRSGGSGSPTCDTIESGFEQSAFSVSWGNNQGQIVTDQIHFQSDREILDEVPEPSSILLLLTSLVGVYGAVYAHRKVLKH